MTRRAVVLGGSGFLGTRLVPMLLEREWRVQQIEHVALNDSVAAVEAACTDDVDLVVNIAASRGCDTLTSTDQMIDAHVRMPVLLVAALARRGGGAFLTSSTYQRHLGATPASLSVAMRASLEPVLAWVQQHAGVRCATLSPTSMYGPGDTRPKLVPTLVRHALNDTEVSLVGAAPSLDLVHVDDAARAYALAADLLCDGVLPPEARYDVCSGVLTTIEQVVALVGQATGRCVRVASEPLQRASSEGIEAPNRPHIVPGWSPHMSLEQGLREVAAAAMGV